MDDLDALSDEKLSLMEQNTRNGRLARLKYLTNIKCKLDATIRKMNHYSSAWILAG